MTLSNLKSLTIEDYGDKNTLESQALEVFANKATNCEELKLNDIYGKPESNALLAEMAGEICQNSQNLRVLEFTRIRITAEEGAAFLQAVADSDLTTL